MYWCDSLCMRSRSAWPVRATSGARSRKASATAVMRFMAPGPERAQADARPPGQPPVDVRDVGAALLVSDRNELDRGVRQRFVEVEGLLARDAEHVLDALGLEAFDEHIRCFARTPSEFDSNNANSPATPRLCPFRLVGLAPTRSVTHPPCAVSPSSPSSRSSRCPGRGAAVRQIDPRRRLRPRHRDEPVRRLRLRPARGDYNADPRPLLQGHGPRRRRAGPDDPRAASDRQRHGDVHRRDRRAGGHKLDPAQDLPASS